MTNPPDFNGLTPPDELLEDLHEGHRSWTTDILIAYRAGARHGWEQARQLWPEEIRDRPPTEADGDKQGWVMIVHDGVWRPWHWEDVGDSGWLHTPRWQPRRPSLQEQALALLPYDPQAGIVTLNSVEVLKIRRALEQAGEGKA